MKNTLLRIAVLSVAVPFCIALYGKEKNMKAEVVNTRLYGFVGERVDDCIRHRIMDQPLDDLIAPFKYQDEEQGRWASEFWGKWVQGAMASFQYNGDPLLYSKIREAQLKLMECQLPNGYIGDYPSEKETTGWDVWGRKYTLLGLIKWYRISGDKQALKAARRLLDYTLSQIGPGKKSIFQCGFYRGMPPASILEPVMFLYNETHDERYLDFAKYIVRHGEEDGGPQLLAKADVPVAQRFPLSPGQNWWSWENGQKGYEMMSCYIGMLELYKVTGQTELLDAACKAWQHILEEEINITGGACSKECWFNGKALQTHPASHTMETCVTFTWMQFCERLYELTGESKYADQFELTAYNALMASMKNDGTQIVKYVPLEGYRREGEHQCDVPMNCCNANGTRAFAMIPRFIYTMRNSERIDVNLYIPSETTVRVGKNVLVLKQETLYPQSGEVDLVIQDIQGKQDTIACQIALRVPQWSEKTKIEVNGVLEMHAKPGLYCVLTRSWKKGDRIRISLDMLPHLHRQQHMLAVTRGPIVMARDSRFSEGFVDEVISLVESDERVSLSPIDAPENVWIAFKLSVRTGTYQDSLEDNKEIILCDFASAGNTWDERNRYKVWLPELYVPQ